jgi:hypothetical protein
MARKRIKRIGIDQIFQFGDQKIISNLSQVRKFRRRMQQQSFTSISHNPSTYRVCACVDFPHDSSYPSGIDKAVGVGRSDYSTRPAQKEKPSACFVHE